MLFGPELGLSVQALAAVKANPAILTLSAESLEKKCGILRSNLSESPWCLTMADIPVSSFARMLCCSDARLLRLEFFRSRTVAKLAPSTVVKMKDQEFELRFPGFQAWLHRTHGILLKSEVPRT